jgi:hypothetical protein
MRRFAKLLFPVVVAATMVLFIGWGAASGSAHDGHELVGTWRVAVQLTKMGSCSTGTPISPPPFQSLLTFEEGGTMIEDTTNPGFEPGQRGTGHGVWEHQDHRTYSANSVAFINFTTTAPLPAPLMPFMAGTQTIGQTIEFGDGSDEWTTTDATVEFFATGSTTPYKSACANASAKRFE